MYLESHVLERVWLINCEGDQHDMRIEIREHVKSLDMGNGVRSSQNLNSRLDDYRVFHLATGEFKISDSGHPAKIEYTRGIPQRQLHMFAVEPDLGNKVVKNICVEIV